MLKETAQAILETPYKVDIRGMRGHPIFFWRQVPFVKTFELQPLSLGSLTRISELILDINPDYFAAGKAMQDLTYELALKHGRALATIVAVGFTNTKAKPREELVDMILEYVTPAQLADIFSVIVAKIDITGFITSIVSIRGTSILTRTNPADQGSQIASGEPSEESSSTSGSPGTK
ncbi:hypothetical protein [Flavihumibacter petaseus]|uniref:Uncharacterized protein n=1 Tax=Flavihumibacter petaseus NBRC 106054 TaxID=1220578 RepID=A0A0E9N191_9BACT|nr:hypothetical protein [Flavihumibacter petaseus]GAO43797.1 hypothetical protein FPE01S_02_09030 [Flavihumibacter petaseus NBRC 106054]